MNKYFFLVSIFLISLLSSCSHLNHLNRAQNAFNEGAALENSSKFTDNAFTTIAPQNYYRMAYAELEDAMKLKGKLQKDSVYTTALTLKALCEWKLKNYEKATATSVLAANELTKQAGKGLNMTRDLALMKALNGLIQSDKANDGILVYVADSGKTALEAKQAYEALINDPSEKKANIEKAFEILETAKTAIDSTHEVQVYFVLCQLASLKVKRDGIDMLDQKLAADATISNQDADAISGFLDTEESSFALEKETYLNMLKDLLKIPDTDPTYLFWEKRL